MGAAVPHQRHDSEVAIRRAPLIPADGGHAFTAFVLYFAVCENGILISTLRGSVVSENVHIYPATHVPAHARSPVIRYAMR